MNLLLIISMLCNGNSTKPGSRITRSHVNLMTLPLLHMPLWQWGEGFVGGVCLVHWHPRELTIIFIMNLFRWPNRQASIVGIPQALWRMAWFWSKVCFGASSQFAASFAGFGLRILRLRPARFVPIPISAICALLYIVLLEFIWQIHMLFKTNLIVFFIVFLDGFHIFLLSLFKLMQACACRSRLLLGSSVSLGRLAIQI